MVDANPYKFIDVLQGRRDMPPNTNATMFIFLSSQLLCQNSLALNTFIGRSAMGTLRTVVLDEIHLLYVEHGLSFQGEICMLKDIFFLPVFHPKDEGRWKPGFWV